MNSKTNRYSQSIVTLLDKYYNLTAAETQALKPEKVFDLIVTTELGRLWVREIRNWIEAVGGRIEWEAEAKADEVPFTHYTPEINYNYVEDLDD